MNKNKALVDQGFENWSKGTGSFFDLLTEDVLDHYRQQSYR